MNLNLLSYFTCFPSRVRRVCAIALLLSAGLYGVGAIAPQVVQAYVARVDLGVDRLPNEGYDSMVRRAELIARAAAQRTFDKDILTSEVSVIVVGRNAGAEAPILMLTVTREQWRSRPDTQRWATYYRNSAGLLRVPATKAPMSVPTAPVAAPQANPVPMPMASPAVAPASTQPARSRVRTRLAPSPTASPSPAAQPASTQSQSAIPASQPEKK
jgi:hypothetical protein